MKGLPVTVRLLDPPMHEFLPTASQLEFEISHLRHLQRATRSVAELPDTLKLLDPELPRDYVESLGKLQQSLAQYRETQRDDALLARREAMLKKVHRSGGSEPDAGAPRRAAGHHLSRNLRNADPGDSRSRRGVRARKASTSIRRSWCRKSRRSKS